MSISIRSVLRKMRAMSNVLRSARNVDMAHPVLKLRYLVEDSPPEVMVTWRRQMAAKCLCPTCDQYLNQIALYNAMFQASNPGVISQLPNPSKEQRSQK